MRGEARGTRDEKHEQTGIRSSLIPHPSSLRREAVLLGLLVAVCLVMGRLSPVFLRVGNLLDMTRHMVEVGLVALAMTLVILTAGIDLSPRFAAVARQRYGLDVIVADVLSAEIPGDRFDLVVLLGTLSNLPDLPASLRRLRGLLRFPGTLVFNYPAADSLAARIYGRKFWMFAPSVSTFMTRRGCRSALEQAGFTIIRTATDRQMPSTRKLLKHSKLTWLLPLFRALRLEHRALPLPVPVPGVRVVWARPADGGGS